MARRAPGTRLPGHHRPHYIATMITVTSPRALLTFLAVALLAGCATTGTRPDAKATAKPAAATYAKVDWKALPAVTDSDLLAGFSAWRSSCTRLKNDAVWAGPCATAATVSDQDPVAIRQFLQRDLDVYALRAGGHQADGVITGYYEPIYPGSLTRTASATVPVYGTPEDLVVVQLDSLYPELKGKRLRGRLDGKVLKPYDDAGTIASKGSKAPVLAWLTDPMDLSCCRSRARGACAWPMAPRCGWPTPSRTATPTAPSAAGWWTRAS